MAKITNKIKQLLSMSVLSERDWYLLSMGLLCILLLIWSGFLSFNNLHFSMGNIAVIHRSVLVWAIDLLVISIPVVILSIVNYNNGQQRKLQNENRLLKEQLDKNVELAEQIGRGELDEIELVDGHLSEVLYNLGTNLKNTKHKEEAYNWISKGKEKISDILRTHNKVHMLADDVIRGIIDYSGGIQGSLYLLKGKELVNIATYAYNRKRFEKQVVPIGKGLLGSVAYEKQMVYRTEIPDDYFYITSGLLGDRKPKSLLIVPLLQEEELQGVFEIGYLHESLPKHVLKFAEELSSVIGRTFYNLKINEQTEVLLKESQEMTVTLKENEKQLQLNAAEMLEAQEELEKSNKLLEGHIQEVEHAQQRLEALLTNASEFISIYNEKQELVFESPSVKHILGYGPEDKVSGMDPELMTPRGYKTINNLFQYLLETPGGEQSAQYTYLKKSGEKLFLETTGKNLLHDPAIRGIIFNTQDITERKRAEKEERMKSRMQSLSENSPDMIIRINTGGKLVYVNPKVADFIGLPASELVKNRVNELDIDERFRDYMLDSLKQIRAEEKQVISEVEVQAGEQTLIMEIKAIPEFNEDRDLESVLFVAHDMTEFKKIEQEIKEKNKKISDSINYAQRIQTAILPDTKVLQQFFPRSFIFYRPKDVVSGDFPWMFKKDNFFYIAAVDCTGHGVPGALLSFIGYFLMNNIVNASDSVTASELLDSLHLDVRRTLRQDQEGSNGRDGMDLALVKIDLESDELQFAGAHNPLYYLSDGELSIYKGSRKGIGGKPLAKKVEKDFENNIIQYKKGDQFFIFSDGLPDQVGGPKGRKYQSKRIREALEAEPNQTMAHFERHFSNDFYDWMGEYKQVDDVLLIGIEL
ncbi:PAS domain S-box protein [Carboxylicivirga sediminis]|uniref:PAS domain S-box protein n=1 Tax=Carboxylicivirga sediminis TaxID=2006564 RepID=A0A941IZ11_9BACT|nr:PAS domain S-box protein [Carboxylicivirga sediminis]MBR8537059.1 PAS domain S-box protein [Carboxylicivirga sediminis]